MACNTEEILLYIEGELGPEDAARVRAHASACAACHEVLLTEQALASALGDLKAPEPPPGFATATVRRAQCDVTQTMHCPHERRRAVLMSAGLGGLALLLLWPLGVLPSILQTLAPLRCLGKFAIAWVSNATWSMFLVCRTIFRSLFAESHLNTVGGLLVLAGLLALLVWMVAGYRQSPLSASREKRQ